MRELLPHTFTPYGDHWPDSARCAVCGEGVTAINHLKPAENTTKGAKMPGYTEKQPETGEKPPVRVIVGQGTDKSDFATHLFPEDIEWMTSAAAERQEATLDMTGRELRQLVARIDAEFSRLAAVQRLMGDTKSELIAVVHPR